MSLDVIEEGFWGHSKKPIIRQGFYARESFPVSSKELFKFPPSFAINVSSWDLYPISSFRSYKWSFLTTLHTTLLGFSVPLKAQVSYTCNCSWQLSAPTTPCMAPPPYHPSLWSNRLHLNFSWDGGFTAYKSEWTIASQTSMWFHSTEHLTQMQSLIR